jgi:hypothetical protein
VCEGAARSRVLRRLRVRVWSTGLGRGEVFRRHSMFSVNAYSVKLALETGDRSPSAPAHFTSIEPLCRRDAHAPPLRFPTSTAA